MASKIYISGLTKSQMVYLGNIKLKRNTNRFDLMKMYTFNVGNTSTKRFSSTVTTEHFKIVRVLPHFELFIDSYGTISVS